MDQNDRELLVDAAASAWRPQCRGDLPIHPAWYDLDEQGREAAFAAAHTLRAPEAALDPDGLSTTGRAVLHRIDNRVPNR